MVLGRQDLDGEVGGHGAEAFGDDFSGKAAADRVEQRLDRIEAADGAQERGPGPESAGRSAGKEIAELGQEL
jgi:hypothetical protein